MLNSANIFQSSVLVLNGFYRGDPRGIHAIELRPPIVKRGRAHAVFTAQFCHPIPPSAWRRIERICGSLYLMAFMRNLLMQ